MNIPTQPSSPNQAMNTKPEETTQPSSPNQAMNTNPEETTHSHQQPSSPYQPEETTHSHQPSSPYQPEETPYQAMNTKPEETTHSHQPSSPNQASSYPPIQDQNTAVPIETTSSPSSPPSTSIPPPTTTTTTTTQDKKREKWGTHIMGPPAAPSSHPNNQKAAALWTPDQEHQHDEEPQHPYVKYPPVEKSNTNPKEPVIHVFNSWSNKAESLARNIWQNLKTGSSVSEAVYGKVGLTTKVLTGGGFESLYKQSFNVTDPNEKLKKTFACYLSTSTGPVAGTLYLTNTHVAFCSDRPLSFPSPSGQVAWSYYKVMIPLAKISSVNPINMKDNPPERYIQIATVDNHDFWFMGFINYDKASLHLSQSFPEIAAPIVHPV